MQREANRLLLQGKRSDRDTLSAALECHRRAVSILEQLALPFSKGNIHNDAATVPAKGLPKNGYTHPDALLVFTRLLEYHKRQATLLETSLNKFPIDSQSPQSTPNPAQSDSYPASLSVPHPSITSPSPSLSPTNSFRQTITPDSLSIIPKTSEIRPSIPNAHNTRTLGASLGDAKDRVKTGKLKLPSETERMKTEIEELKLCKLVLGQQVCFGF